MGIEAEARRLRGLRCIARIASGGLLLVRDKRRRRDNEAIEHELVGTDPGGLLSVSAWNFGLAPGNGWGRSLVASGAPRVPAVIPKLWGRYALATGLPEDISPRLLTSCSPAARTAGIA